MEPKLDEALREWEKLQPSAVTDDAVWRLDCYREALFLLYLGRADMTAADCRSASQATRDQLLKALGSIGANLAEGYGRSTNIDRMRFVSYSLGSAREAVVWYQALLPLADDVRLADRLDRLARIKRMLLGLVGRMRKKTQRPFEHW